MSSRREILEQVASGDLSPEDAERLLREETPAETSSAPETPIKSVKVVVGAGGVDIEGDPRVAQAEVEGPHRAEVDGDELVITSEFDDDTPLGSGAFAINIGGPRRHIRIGPRGASWRGRNVSRLKVRMNPELALDTELDAGPLSIKDIRRAIRVRVAAGPVSIDGFEGPLDIGVNAGAVRATGKLTEGDSRIRADAGAVRVELDPSSSVRVVAKASLGKVRVSDSGTDDDDERRGRFGADRRREVTIGTGDATLRVETSMGSINIGTR